MPGPSRDTWLEVLAARWPADTQRVHGQKAVTKIKSSPTAQDDAAVRCCGVPEDAAASGGEALAAVRSCNCDCDQEFQGHSQCGHTRC